MPHPTTLAELVRLPAVLTVPGDVLLGAAASGEREAVARAARLTAASSLLYMAGMALNDYADREVDAVERPQRPIPSGRVDPGVALLLAGAMTAGAVGVSASAGGKRSLALALPLAGTVWAYDLLLKDTRAGPAAMALARSLDVLLGATHGRIRRALPAAAVVGAHTLLITLVSRREVEGGTRQLARSTLAGTAAVMGGGFAFVGARLAACTAPAFQRRTRLAASLALAGAYGTSLGRAELAAVREPSPENMQRVVRTGILGLIPLESALLAACGPAWTVPGIAAVWPLAGRLARRRSVT